MMVEYKCFQWQDNTVTIYAGTFDNATVVNIVVQPPIDKEWHITQQNFNKRLRCGMALCHPGDVYDLCKGIKLACRSALNVGKHYIYRYSGDDVTWERQLYSAIRKALKGSDNA